MESSFKIEREKIGFFIDNYDIFIPPFQRKLSWNGPKKEALIDSLIKKYPIGALTLYSNSQENNYYLVDGLQRYNTIKSYLLNPASIYDFKDFYQFIREDIEKFAFERNHHLKKLKSVISKWFDSLNTSNFDETKRYLFEDFNLFANTLKNNGFDNIASDFESCSSLRQILIDKIDFRMDYIALIIYEGDIENLPDIFAKINQKNISLSSYEILHSIWYKYDMECEFNGVNYKDLFKKMIDENKAYQTTEVETFNVFMYISALSYLYSKDIKTINDDNNAFFDSYPNNVFIGEVVFDAFSTIIRKTSNEVDKAIRTIWDDPNRTSRLFVTGELVVNTFKRINEFICNNQIMNISSKYMYLYLFYLYYHFRDKNLSRINKKFIDDIVDAQWFRGQNRQISFFKKKIKEIDEYKELNDYLNNILLQDYDN